MHLEPNSDAMKLANYAVKNITARYHHLRGTIDNTHSLSKTACVMHRLMSHKHSPKSDLAIRDAIDYACIDDFWKTKFLDPQMLERENGDGIKYIDFFLAQIGYREPRKILVSPINDTNTIDFQEAKKQFPDLKGIDKPESKKGESESIGEILE